MTVPTFSYTLVAHTDDVMLRRLYDLARANPPRTMPCTDKPGYLLSDLQRFSRRGHLAAVIEDGFGLRGWVAFTKRGRVVGGAAIYYEPTGMVMDRPDVEAWNRYLYDVVRAVTGDVSAETTDPAYAAYVERFGVATPEPGTPE